jgi:peptidoglycan/LPS O-acetylase OafA/YrhL
MTRRLLFLNGLAALMLAIHHATGYGFNAMFDWTDRYMQVAVPNYNQAGSFAFYVNVLIQQLDYFALPAFMFVSGFFAVFVFGNSSTNTKWVNIKTRVINLVIPFLFWSVAFFILFLRRLPDNLDEVLDRYYYIPLVIQFYILSPFLIRFAKNHWKLFLFGALFLDLGRFTVRYIYRLGFEFPGIFKIMEYTPRWLFPMLFSWFALGMVAHIYRLELMRWLPRYKWHLLAATVALAILSMVEYVLVGQAIGQVWLGHYFGGYARFFYGLAFIFCFLSFEDWTLPSSKQILYLGSKSLGIYLVHNRLMYLAAVFLYNRVPQVLGNQFLYQGILIVFALGGSLLLMELVKATPARRYYKYLFG